MPQMMCEYWYMPISWSARMSYSRHVASSDQVVNANPLGKIKASKTNTIVPSMNIELDSKAVKINSCPRQRNSATYNYMGTHRANNIRWCKAPAVTHSLLHTWTLQQTALRFTISSCYLRPRKKKLETSGSYQQTEKGQGAMQPPEKFTLIEYITEGNKNEHAKYRDTEVWRLIKLNQRISYLCNLYKFIMAEMCAWENWMYIRVPTEEVWDTVPLLRHTCSGCYVQATTALRSNAYRVSSRWSRHLVYVDKLRWCYNDREAHRHFQDLWLWSFDSMLREWTQPPASVSALCWPIA